MTRVKQPNPQGKGVNSSMDVLARVTDAASLPEPRADSRKAIARDYLGSLFVLSCRFKFCPVQGREYYIYNSSKGLVLSLISPDEGGENIYSRHIADCRLKADGSWHVDFSKDEAVGLILRKQPIKGPNDSLDMVAQSSDPNFIEQLATGQIGRYREDLGYYQNVLHYLLGKTISHRSRRVLEITD